MLFTPWEPNWSGEEQHWGKLRVGWPWHVQGAAPHRDRFSSPSPPQPVFICAEASSSQHSFSEGFFVVVLWWGIDWNEEP